MHTTASPLSWNERKKFGDEAESEFDAMMRAAGFVVSPTSQEANITDEMRAALLQIDDRQARELRFQPDRFLVRATEPIFPPAYWEVKTQTSDYPNFSIEQDHYTTNVIRMRSGMRIVYAFREYGGLWRADWMVNLVDFARPRDGGRNGSRKPMVLIGKYNVTSLSKFLARPFEK